MTLYSRALMTLSAVFLASLGVTGSFLPQEVLSFAGVPATALGVVMVELAGALYLGFAVLNWAARGVLIGGIYARPLAMGNFLQHAVGATILLKRADDVGELIVWVIGLLYGLFALWFGAVLFTHPKQANNS